MKKQECKITSVVPYKWTLNTRIKNSISQLKSFPDELSQIKVITTPTTIPFVLEATSTLFKKENTFEVTYFEEIENISERINKNMEKCIIGNTNIFLNSICPNPSSILFDNNFIPIAYKTKESYKLNFVDMNQKFKENTKNLSLNVVGDIIFGDKLKDNYFYTLIIGDELFRVDSDFIHLVLFYAPLHAQIYAGGLSKRFADQDDLEVLSFDAFYFMFSFLYKIVFLGKKELPTKHFINTVYGKFLENKLLPYFTNNIELKNKDLKLGKLSKIFQKFVDIKLEERNEEKVKELLKEEENEKEKEVINTEDKLGYQYGKDDFYYQYSLSNILTNPNQLHALNFIDLEKGWVFINPDCDINLDGILLSKEDILYIMIDDSYQFSIYINFNTDLKSNQIIKLETALLHRLNLRCEIFLSSEN